MTALTHDLRFALRMLLGSPGTTIVAILALALGIGANTAIFSVVDGVLLQPLPLPDSRELYAIHTGSAKRGEFRGEFSYPEYQDMVAQQRTLASIGGWIDGDANLSGADAPVRIPVRFALPTLLPTLRVEPALGRGFLPEETAKGREHVILLDHGLWQRQFAGAKDVIGKSLRLDGVSYQIVGVLPRGFRFAKHVDAWVPLMTEDESFQVRNAHFLDVVGRRRAESTLAGINADLAAVALREAETYPEFFPSEFGFGIRAIPYLDKVVGDVRLPLLVLLGAVGCVLLIACANVANLLLARAATREREMAVRAALGASRLRLVRQLLTESLVLSLIGGALGVLFAAWGIDALIAMSPDSLPRVGEIALDLRVLAFTALIALATGVGFGLVPALSASRPALHDALKDGTRGTTVGRGRLRKALVVFEVALSLVLLIGAGLMVRSFVRLRAVDPGFRVDHALMLRVSLPVPGEITAADEARFVSFFTRAADRLQKLPGVTAAGASTMLPLDGRMTDRLFDIEGYVPPPGVASPDAQNRVVTPGWFQAMGIPLLRGRAFTDADGEKVPRVVVVNQAFVQKFFPQGDPLGKRIRLGALGPKQFPWAAIVGVIGDVRGYGQHAPPMPEMYRPLAQVRDTSSMSLVVRTSGQPSALTNTVRTALAEIDPAQPIFDLQTVEQMVSTSLDQRRFTLTLMVLFGGVALLLAMVGIYGVMSYSVVQRTQEIGIRMALGAQAGDVLRMLLRDGMRLVASGLLAGTAVALVLTRIAASLLFGVSASDAATYAAIASVLTAVALVAILLPARRAMRVDPMQALRR
jgi:putative ABC transport system permease protein